MEWWEISTYSQVLKSGTWESDFADWEWDIKTEKFSIKELADIAFEKYREAFNSQSEPNISMVRMHHIVDDEEYGIEEELIEQID